MVFILTYTEKNQKVTLNIIRSKIGEYFRFKLSNIQFRKYFMKQVLYLMVQCASDIILKSRPACTCSMASKWENALPGLQGLKSATGGRLRPIAMLEEFGIPTLVLCS
jgi:hypothetical protein